MPKWKSVPSLKTLSLRRIAWPDAVDKAAHSKKSPTIETYTRFTLIQKYFEDKYTELKRKRRHNIHTEKEPLRKITEDVVNAWIRLSNFYETRLSDFDSMSMFMRTATIGTLDFLHEGFTLETEKDFLKNILPYIGVVPYTLKPQHIDYRTWLDLVNVMVMAGICETLQHLYIPFGNYKIRHEKTPHGQAMTPLVYRFEDTLVHFTFLKTIIVRGEASDSFMHAVGENCFFLEYLDIRGSHISDRGIALLLFRKLGKRFFKGTFLPSHCRSPFYPTDILQPCCATLKYLDVSETLVEVETNHVYDMHIIRACPQLKPTPMRFYYNVPGNSKIMLRNFSDGIGLTNFRQQLVHYMRQMQCDRLFEFVQGLLGCIHFEEPSLEVIENDIGEETSFLFISGSCIMIHCELENLSVLTLVSYSRSVLSFLPLSLVSKFAPKLKKLKASLKGTLTEATIFKSLKYVCAPMVHDVNTLVSLVEFSPELEYLEVRDVLMIDTALDFGDGDVERIFPRDPGDYKNLQVLRFIFPNKILLHPGLSWVVVRCPSLKIIGDLGYWAIPFDTLVRIYTNTSFHNYNFAIEHEGMLHYCGKKHEIDLARFE